MGKDIKTRIVKFLLEVLSPIHFLDPDFEPLEYLRILATELGECFDLWLTLRIQTDEEAGQLDIIAANVLSVTDAERVRVTRDSPIPKHLEKTGSPYYSKDLRSDSLYRQQEWAGSARLVSGETRSLRSGLFVPVMKNGRVVGILALFKDRVDGFDDREELEFLSGPLMEVVRRVWLYSEELGNLSGDMIRERTLSSVNMTQVLGSFHTVGNYLSAASQKAITILSSHERGERIDREDAVSLASQVIGARKAHDSWNLVKTDSRVVIKDLVGLARAATRSIAVAGRRKVPATRLTFTTGSRVTILGRVEQLRNLFFNLAWNAYQAVEERGDTEEGRIHIAVEEIPNRKTHVRVTVLDNGPGFPESILNDEKVLEMGVSTRRAQGGRGLGLFLCSQIAKGHGGSIHVGNNQGGGAWVAVTLHSHREQWEEVDAHSRS